MTDVSNVTSGSLTYTYLSDGTKVSAIREDGSGKRYLGSAVYSVPESDGGSETLESAAWDEGRIFFDVEVPVDSTGNGLVVVDSIPGIGCYRDCWYVTDHLGNVRSIVDISASLAAPQVVERNDYLPFGTRLSVGAGTGTGTGAGTGSGDTVLEVNRYRLGGKEEQSFGSLDLGKVDFGARQYDPFTARWTTIDPMAEKYASLSPYSYCADNSVNYIDSQGDTLVVLLAPDAAAGFGHMAILIQHEDNRYYLYSKNGDKDWGIFTSIAGDDDKSNDIGELSWKSPETFISDGGHMFNYTEALIIPTTPIKDAVAKEQAVESISSTYNLFFSNCAQSVIQILEKAGIPTEPNYNPSSEMPVFRTIPRLVYPQIKMVNPNSRIIKKETRP